MKRNFVLIAMIAVLFVFAAGCEKKEKETEPEQPSTTAPENNGEKPTPGDNDTPAEPDKNPDENGDAPTQLPPGDEIPDITPPDTGSGPATPGEIVETPDELRVKSNSTLDYNLDGLQLYNTAPNCGNVYRLFLVKLYDGKSDELYAMLDAKSQENIALKLDGNRPNFEDEAKYETLRKYYERQIKIAKKRYESEEDALKKQKELYVLEGFSNEFEMYKKIKAAYTKEMTPAEYYAIAAEHYGKIDERDLERFLDPRLKPVVAEKLEADGRKCAMTIERRFKGEATTRIFQFTLQDGEWKIADPFNLG